MFTFISQAFLQGGIFMYAIMAVQIVSLAVIAERIFTLYLRRSTGQRQLADTLEQDIKKGMIDSAQMKAMTLSNSEPIGNVALAGIRAAASLGGKDEIHSRMEEMLNIETSKLERRTPLLAMIGNVATLIGLLGTITGMIKSFSAVSIASASEKATLLSSGISEAMNCTAYGLLVAIPALVLHSVLTGRAHSLQDDLNQAASKVLNWLCYNFEAAPNSRKKSY